MKYITLLTLFFTTFSYAQQRKAAIIGLSSYRANVVHSYTNQEIPTCYVKNGETYNDSIAFLKLANKIDSILTTLDFQLIPSEEVINDPVYTDLSADNLKRRRQQPNLSPQKPAKGYGYVEGNGLGGVNYLKEYFKIAANPDMVIDAYTSYDLKLTESVKGNMAKGFVLCDIRFTGYSPKKKKIIKFKSSFKTPMALAIERDTKTCWGYRITGDYGQLQMKALTGALKKLDDVFADQKASVEKFYSK